MTAGFMRSHQRKELVNQMKTTARPWRISAQDKRAILAGRDAKTVRIAKVTGSDSISDAEDGQHAAFIVTACNAHDDLVAALRSMLADVEAYQSNPHGHRPINYIAVARAALALAGKVGE